MKYNIHVHVHVCVVMQGKELEGSDVSGNLCIRKPWPGMARSIFGDHKRFLDTYYRPYPGTCIYTHTCSS